MTRRITRALTMALCLVLCVCMWPNAAHAFDPVELNHPLTLTVFANDEETPLAGVEIILYKVASMNALAQFDLLEAYAGFTGDINKLENAAAWMAAADYMLPIAQGGTPDFSGTTGDDGILTFSGLTPGLYLVYGEPADIDPWIYSFAPFIVSVPTRDMEDEWIYDVYCDIKLERVPGFTDIRVVKVWDDGNRPSRRPESLIVDLYQDGVVIDTVTLHDGNSWSHTFPDLPAAHTYTVQERKVPWPYEVSYEIINGVLVIRNTFNTDVTPVPGIPSTGQLWWPVPILAALGMILFVVGWITHRKWSQEHE